MTTILIKKKDTAGAPAPGDLTNAAGGTEIAVNTATRRIYTKDSGGNVVELGNNATSSTIDQLTVTTSTTLSYGTANQVQYLNASKLLVGSANLLFDGTTLTPNALTVTNAVTLTAGTANGVLYLNGSKVATSGSALTYNGTGLGVGVASAGFALDVGGSNGTNIALRSTGTASAVFRAYVNSAEAGTIGFLNGGGTYFEVAGTEGMRLTSTGLGIGTTSPTTKLNIVGSSNSLYMEVGGAVRPLRFSSFATISADAGHLINASSSDGAIALATNSVEYFRLNSAGRVGIGTSSPSAKLMVSDSIATAYSSTNTLAADPILYLYNPNSATSAAATIRLDGGVAGGNAATTISAIRIGDGSSALTFGTRNGGADVAERLRIDNAGNLLLASTSANLYLNYTSFQIGAGSAGAIIELKNSAGTGGGHLRLDTTGTTITGLVLETRTTVPLAFGTNGAERMRLTAAGVLVHGVTAPQLSTSIYASGNSAGDGVIGARNGSGSSTFQVIMDSNANCGYLGTSSPNGTALLRLNSEYGTQFTFQGTEYARLVGSLFSIGATAQIINESSLGVNSTGNTATFKATSAGSGAGIQPILCWNSGTSGDNGFVAFFTETAYTARGAIYYNRAGGVTAYGTTSDYRAKDIFGAVTNSGELIDSVPVYMGKMKGATIERPMFLAHETPAYAHSGEKDAVDKDGKPVYQTMDASTLVPVMWAEIQSLRKRLAAAGIA
jgi:hypothetical protein